MTTGKARNVLCVSEILCAIFFQTPTRKLIFNCNDAHFVRPFTVSSDLAFSFCLPLVSCRICTWHTLTLHSFETSANFNQITWRYRCDTLILKSVYSLLRCGNICVTNKEKHQTSNQLHEQSCLRI
jgi:hypothetical protein